MLKLGNGKFFLRLASLFNNVILTGIVPEKWKIIKFCPVRKDKTSFRPIALTESLRKVFEKIILTRINWRGVDQQAGFVKGRNTVDQAVTLDDHLRRSRGNLKVIALDIRKAYDSVDRRILYGKLLKAGLNRLLVRTVVGMSEGVMCHVVSGNLKSGEKLMTRGLPQGSVISPLLFNIFIDDIVSYIPEPDRFKILLYADDILLFSYSQGTLQELLNHVEKHSLDNAYRFNPKKCQYMSAEELDLKLYNEILERTHCLRYLGFYFHRRGFDNLKTVGIIRRAAVYKSVIVRRGVRKVYGKHCDPRHLLGLYKSYIRPSLDYSVGVGFCRKSLVKRLELLQKKCVKYLFGWPKKMPTNLVYALLPLEEIQLRANILALGIYKRLSMGVSRVRNLVLKGKTGFCTALRDNADYFCGEEIELLKENLFTDARMDVFGQRSGLYKFKYVKNHKLWWETVSSLLITVENAELFNEKKKEFISLC